MLATEKRHRLLCSLVAIGLAILLLLGVLLFASLAGNLGLGALRRGRCADTSTWGLGKLGGKLCINGANQSIDIC